MAGLGLEAAAPSPPASGRLSSPEKFCGSQALRTEPTRTTAGAGGALGRGADEVQSQLGRGSAVASGATPGRGFASEGKETSLAGGEEVPRPLAPSPVLSFLSFSV